MIDDRWKIIRNKSKYVDDVLEVKLWINGVYNGSFPIVGMGTNKYSSGAAGMPVPRPW